MLELCIGTPKHNMKCVCDIPWMYFLVKIFVSFMFQIHIIWRIPSYNINIRNSITHSGTYTNPHLLFLIKIIIWWRINYIIKVHLFCQRRSLSYDSTAILHSLRRWMRVHAILTFEILLDQIKCIYLELKKHVLLYK